MRFGRRGRALVTIVHTKRMYSQIFHTCITEYFKSLVPPNCQVPKHCESHYSLQPADLQFHWYNWFSVTYREELVRAFVFLLIGWVANEEENKLVDPTVSDFKYMRQILVVALKSSHHRSFVGAQEILEGLANLVACGDDNVKDVIDARILIILGAVLSGPLYDESSKVGQSAANNNKGNMLQAGMPGMMGLPGMMGFGIPGMGTQSSMPGIMGLGIPGVGPSGPQAQSSKKLQCGEYTNTEKLLAARCCYTMCFKPEGRAAIAAIPRLAGGMFFSVFQHFKRNSTNPLNSSL